MPKIPQANNQANISVGATPRIAIPEMGLGAASKSAQAQSEVIQAIANAENVLIRVRDFRQQIEAQNYAFEKLNEIKSRADQDVNFDSSPYETEIDKVGQEAAKSITGRLAKEEFMAGFQRQATAAKWGVKNEFRAKELRSIDASIDYQAQQIIDNYGGMNDADRITNVANFRRSLENGVKIGLYNKATAEAKYAEFQKKVFKGQVEYDIYNDTATQEEDSVVLAELRRGKEGTYAFLDANTRLEMIKDSQRRIFQNNQTYKREVTNQQQIKIDNVINKFIDGTLTYKDLEAERNIPEEAGGLEPTKIDAFKKRLDTQIEHNLKLITENNAKANDYMIFIKNYIDDATDREKALEYLANAYADGLLSREEAKYLTQLKKYMADVKWQKFSDNAIIGLKQFYQWMSKNSKDEKDATMKIKRFLNGLQESQNPAVDSLRLIDEEIKRNRLEKYPWIANLPPTGEVRLFPDGTKKCIYPDGRIEEIK